MSRTNGFERPFHFRQVVGWIVFGTDSLMFGCVGLPLIDSTLAQVLVGIVWASSLLVLVCACAKATSCNPADPHVVKQMADFKEEDIAHLPYCTSCQAPVFPRSKHCRTCDKCVNVFDHHCHWLNNCIGSENYRAFAVLIVSVAIMTGVVLATVVYLLVDFLVNPDEFDERLQTIEVVGVVPKEVLFVLFVFLTVMNAPLFVLDVQLVLLHAFLMSQKLTTYEYAIYKRDLQLEMEVRGTLEDSEAKPKVSSSLAKRIKTLPSCLDWFVFAKCSSQRRRKKCTDTQPSIPAGGKTQEEHHPDVREGVVLGSPCEEHKKEEDHFTFENWPTTTSREASADTDTGGDDFPSIALKVDDSVPTQAPSLVASTGSGSAKDNLFFAGREDSKEEDSAADPNTIGQIIIRDRSLSSPREPAFLGHNLVCGCDPTVPQELGESVEL
eukprot:TRINITY_DN3599_c0_g2_i1.p1 TRINITY_DN3599_c0_g2~~TRINITY_DN3599_c0_g2_i1.p1  ORF type:complete len:439 (+),score=96.36 TRINITY_DN3599_c0_g2_i1:98-1414(+)